MTDQTTEKIGILGAIPEEQNSQPPVEIPAEEQKPKTLQELHDEQLEERNKNTAVVNPVIRRHRSESSSSQRTGVSGLNRIDTGPSTTINRRPNDRG